MIYDAEGNVIQTWKDGQPQNAINYVYDAFNNRVSGLSSWGPTEWTYTASGQRVSSWLLSGGGGFGGEGRIYWDGALVANRSLNGTTYFHHGDWLGTERLRTDYQGNAVDTERSLASGESFAETANDPYGASQDNDQFTGQEYDGESGTDHFQFRQYQPTQGRWLSPDPYDGSYDYSNPQSFNRYAYVLNNPFTLTDPDGRTVGCTVVSIGGTAVSAACQGFEIAGDAICGPLCGEVLGDIAAAATALFTFGFHKPPFHGNVQASQHGKNIPKCPTVPNHPPNASVDANVASTSARIGYETPGADSFIRKANWFQKVCCWTSEWNYQQGVSGVEAPEYDAFGNFNFGATGVAAGFSQSQLMWGQGVAKNLNYWSKLKANPYSKLPFHNDPTKVANIQHGIDYAKNGCKSD